MNPTEAARSITHSEQLAAQSRHSGRWYAHYLLIYAAASFVLSSAFGLVEPRLAVAVVMPLWFAVIAALTYWALQRRTQLTGLPGLHLTVIAVWGVLWCITVIVGTNIFLDTWWWWVAGGIAMATPPAVGAAVAVRRTAA